MEDEPRRSALTDDDGGKNEAVQPGPECSVRRTKLTLAHIIGRRLAREDFERLRAANENGLDAPKAKEDPMD
ncbi:hypothetical protein DOI34_24680 [Salmonella enterica subsp. enterica serovar Virchow]|nr:hypothetical protein [Salmonella enterica subsp. enterica serovar Virchow]ECD4520222.1 hypothetical protein [Salmonella enterica subsp. enterica serovar Virchow]EFG8200281.1 hypothetical protein [Escherichia coli]MIL09525.1 hypothetical protein [Salmonella enterica subsp. enterica serovar Enteritidis]